METTRTATLLRIAREALAKRADTADEGADSGFTLIELMVVLLILAILLAIAIPTFLGVTSSAHDRAAQSNLTNALTAAKASYVNNQAYQGTSVAEAGTLNSNEPELNFTGAAASSDQNHISVGVYKDSVGAPYDVLVLAVYSQATKNCWYAADVELSSGVTINGVKIGNNAGASGGVAYAENANVAASTCDANNGLTTAFPVAITNPSY